MPTVDFPSFLEKSNSVEFFESATEPTRVDAEIGGQLLHRIRNNRPALQILAAQERHCLLIENLIGDMTRLGEDGSTDLGVGVNLKVFALIDESFSLRVDHDAVGV